MDYNSINRLMDKYFEGNTTLEEEKNLLEYFSTNEQIPKELRIGKAIYTNFEKDKKVTLPLKNPISFKKLFYIISGAAAILFFILWFSNHPKNENGTSMITTINIDNKAKKVEIGKGNIAWLNKGASITYQKKPNQFNNIIDVKGEVYFEITSVENCKYQFLVYTTIIQVNSPTCFNIKTNDISDNIDVTVKSGVIKALGGSNSLGLLVPADNFCSINKKHNVAYSTINKNKNYLAWKTGELIFDSIPMATVTEILAEFYNVDIEIENKKIAYCMFTGNFNKEPLEHVIKKIEEEMDVQVRTEKNKITLTGNSCL